MYQRKRGRHSKGPGSTDAVEHAITFWLLASLLVVSPWIRGGNRQVALAVLLGLGLILLACLAARSTWRLMSVEASTVGRLTDGRPDHRQLSHFPTWKLVVLALVATSPQWVGGIQLIPLPLDWWLQLPGRQSYLAAQQAAGIPTPTFLPMSLNPLATQASIWASIPITAVFLATLTVKERHIYPLVKLLLVLGMAQVALSIAQFATGGSQSPLQFTDYSGGVIVGSFANRNSLADYLAMMVPLWFVVLLHLDRHGQSKRHGDGGPFQDILKPLWALCGFALIITLITTQSRGGLLASMVALFLSLWVYLSTRNRRELSIKAKIGIALLTVAFSAVALMAAGADKVTSRIQRQQLSVDADTRQQLAQSTWEASLALWPWGGGMGTFESVFPRFQHLHSAFSYVNEAHNDYAQLLMDLGVWAALLAVLLVTLVVHQAWQLRVTTKADGRLSTNVAIQWLAGTSTVALLLHSWLDFNMRIPALAMTAACLMAIFLRTPESAHSARHG